MIFVALLAQATEFHMLLKKLFTFNLDEWEINFEKVCVYFTRGGDVSAKFEEKLSQSTLLSDVCFVSSKYARVSTRV